MVSAGHAVVKSHSELPPTLPLTNCQRILFLDTLRRPSAQQAEITLLGQTSIGSPRHSVRSPGSWTTPTHAAPRVPFLQRRITNPTSDQTPAPGPALHPHAHPHRPPTYHARLPLSGLPPGQTPVRGLPLLLLEQSVAVHSPPLVMNVRVRLPVRLLARRHAPVSVAPSLAL